MSRDEQIKFVTSLTKHIAEKLIEDINQDRIPEEWDGVELRELIAVRASYFTMALDRKRRTDFDNIVLVNNL